MDDNENLMDFDELKMYFGEPYKINNRITIHQPTIGEIIDFGEQKMYQSIAPFVGNTTTYRLALWDAGIDWNKITDFELFCRLATNLKKDTTSLIFGDFDFSILQPRELHTKKDVIEEDGLEEDIELVLVDNPDNPTVIIDEFMYTHMAEYIRFMFNQHPKVEYAKGQGTKELIIQEERDNILFAQTQNKDKNVHKSVLLPLISSMVNHPGFKYKKNELRDVGYFEFMDSVKRIQKYESVTALMSGIYSGMLDTSKMNLEKELNWLGSLD